MKIQIDNAACELEMEKESSKELSETRANRAQWTPGPLESPLPSSILNFFAQAAEDSSDILFDVDYISFGRAETVLFYSRLF